MKQWRKVHKQKGDDFTDDKGAYLDTFVSVSLLRRRSLASLTRGCIIVRTVAP